MTEIDHSKQLLRKEMRALLAGTPPADLTAASLAIRDLALAEAPLNEPGATVLLFAPLPGRHEIDLLPLAEALRARGVRTAFPATRWDDRAIEARLVEDHQRDMRTVTHDSISLTEPNPTCALVEARNLDGVLVPGLAFDADGRRLGRGAGFYDRFLLTTPAPVYGIALGAQLVGRVPANAHDVPVDAIITETSILRTPNRRPD